MSTGWAMWYDPRLTRCECRHCRKGRLCKDMADRYKQALDDCWELIHGVPMASKYERFRGTER